MKKIRFIESAGLGVVSMVLYILLEAGEQFLERFLEAYLHAGASSYSSLMYELDFSSLKIIAIVMAVIFFGLAVLSLFFRGEE